MKENWGARNNHYFCVVISILILHFFFPNIIKWKVDMYFLYNYSRVWETQKTLLLLFCWKARPFWCQNPKNKMQLLFLTSFFFFFTKVVLGRWVGEDTPTTLIFWKFEEEDSRGMRRRERRCEWLSFSLIKIFKNGQSFATNLVDYNLSIYIYINI